MKIFGKRSDRQKPKEPPSPTSNNNNDNDEIVRALLREDRPTTWNAKQRRLVKRYRDRIQNGEIAATNNSERTSAAETADEEAVRVLSQSVQPTVDSGDDPVAAGQQHAEDDDDCEESLSEESSGESDSQEEISEIGVKSDRVGAQKPSEAQLKHDEKTESGSDEGSNAKDTSGQPDNGNSFKSIHEDSKEDHADNPDSTQNIAQQQPSEHEASGPASTTIDEDLQAMLDKLNSKQRRKLVRSLERKEMDLETVRSEAKSLLGLDVVENKTTAAVAESPRKKRKRGNNNTDASQIPTEERLRREEQRRLQKEAMEARLKNGGTVLGGGTKTHKHPLNSERRRANRRKPKWETRRPATNEHNSSGFHMRKITSTES